jgi:hypothetical protein
MKTSIAVLLPTLLLTTLLTLTVADAGPRLEEASADDDDIDGTDALPQVAPVPTPPPCGRCMPLVPTVAETVVLAYRAAGLDASPAASWTRRARWGALLPWVSVRTGGTRSWDDPEPDLHQSRTLEVRATWRLDRLVFDGRELSISSIDAARRREKRRLATRVIRVYFAWLRAQRAGDGLLAAEAAAELDALTDNRFTIRHD